MILNAMSTDLSFGLNFSRYFFNFFLFFGFFMDNFRVAVRVHRLDIIFLRNLLQFLDELGVSLLKLLLAFCLTGDVFSKRLKWDKKLKTVLNNQNHPSLPQDASELLRFPSSPRT